MKRIRFPALAAVAIALLTLPATGRAHDAGGDPAAARVSNEAGAVTQGVPVRVAAAFAAAAGKTCQREFGHACVVSALERLRVVDDVVRYRFEVRVGPGLFDVVRMHRVVREHKPFVPARTTEALFVLHGGNTGFEASFMPNLTTGLTPPAHAMPVFMARNGVDVWGMDLGWILAPADATDFSSFADWGFDKEIIQIRAGLGIARALRAATSGDVRRMDLLGWSYGAQLGYVLVAEETELPSWRRHVKGFIPADLPMKYEPGALPDWVCGAAAYYRQVHESGQYADGSAMFYTYVATLAIDDPLGASPVFPGLNNEQAALSLGAALAASRPPFTWWPAPSTRRASRWGCSSRNPASSFTAWRGCRRIPRCSLSWTSSIRGATRPTCPSTTISETSGSRLCTSEPRAESGRRASTARRFWAART